MKVFLIHGMGRSRISMLGLRRALRRAGHDATSFGYSVRRRELAAIGDDFRAFIDDQIESQEQAYAVVGHSLGNIITRLVSPQLPASFSRFVMLGPPNNSPALARSGRNNRLFRMLTGDAGARLGDHAFYAALPIPDVPTRIVAGDCDGRAPWLPYRGGPSDGIVSVEETRLPGIDHHTVNAVHSFIMNHPDARRLVLEFLAT